MYSSITTIFAIAGLIAPYAAGIAIAVPTEPDVAKRATEDSLPYPLVDLKWVGEDGASATGTIQEIAAKLGTDNLSPRDSNPDHLFKRAKTGITCNPNFGNANVGAIQDGINYLNQRGGACVVESRSCSRISCSFNSAILLCNDRYDHIEPDCRYLASYASDIIPICRNGDDVRGQEFDSDNYNIIIGGVGC